MSLSERHRCKICKTFCILLCCSCCKQNSRQDLRFNLDVRVHTIWALNNEHGKDSAKKINFDSTFHQTMKISLESTSHRILLKRNLDILDADSSGLPPARIRPNQQHLNLVLRTSTQEDSGGNIQRALPCLCDLKTCWASQRICTLNLVLSHDIVKVKPTKMLCFGNSVIKSKVPFKPMPALSHGCNCH